MTTQIMDRLEKEGLQINADDKKVYQQILNTTEYWEVPVNKSQHEIWNTLEETLAEPDAKIVKLRPWLKWAASVAVITAITASILFNSPDTQTYEANKIHEISLPDGSSVALNAGSSLTYHESLFGTRNVTLEGKAFFDVVKGDEFVINTEYGSIAVLGTSFNVNTSNSQLAVECFTGKVKVAVPEKSVLLTPGLSVIASAGDLNDPVEFDVTRSKSWINGEFYFQNTSLNEVFVEVERQFDVNIKVNFNSNHRAYTGLFNNTDNIEEVLKSICLPMSLNYNKSSDGSYIVSD